ncbi:MAG TPA: hypothetical protein PK727_04710 [Bacteroidales bacterium]|nr:hypothetical protein [Bacteroidales bacterium]HOG56610.1 hypothetical protein [Bacteroidales bacterium]
MRDSILREDLTYRQAAEHLEIKPFYISMVLNPKLWGNVSRHSWERLEEWHKSRDTIKDFKPSEAEDPDVVQKRAFEQAEKSGQEKPDTIISRINLDPGDTPVPAVGKSPDQTDRKMHLIIDIEIRVNNQTISINAR